MKKELYSVYAREADMTFVMEEITDKNGECASVEVVGFYYGEPSEKDTQYFKGKRKAKFDWKI